MAWEIATMAQQQQALLNADPSLVVGAVANTPAAADEFFNGDQGLVSVHDFDYDLIIGFETQLKTLQLLFCPPLWPVACLCCTPCFLKQKIEWKTRAQHVALTVDGIRYVVDKHQRLCGLPCSDKGRESKTVPYDKITDCDVQEPAGVACCCCVPNVLARVHVDTASSGSEQHPHELSLAGLRYPMEFKQAVWAMKRGEMPGHAVMLMGAVPSQTSATLQAPSQAQMQTALLTEIRDELRALNSNLKAKS